MASRPQAKGARTMPAGDIETLRSIMRVDWYSTLRPEHHEFYLTNNIGYWKKKRELVGRGQCPVLVQWATGAPKVKFWRQGPVVAGNMNIPVGAAIASGWEDGRYPNKKAGNHAAIYLGQNDTGIQVLDQWKNKNVSNGFERTLKFSSNNSSNGGHYFFLVLTQKFISDFEWAMSYSGDVF